MREARSSGSATSISAAAVSTTTHPPSAVGSSACVATPAPQTRRASPLARTVRAVERVGAPGRRTVLGPRPIATVAVPAATSRARSPPTASAAAAVVTRVPGTIAAAASSTATARSSSVPPPPPRSSPSAMPATPSSASPFATGANASGPSTSERLTSAQGSREPAHSRTASARARWSSVRAIAMVTPVLGAAVGPRLERVPDSHTGRVLVTPCTRAGLRAGRRPPTLARCPRPP